MHHEMNPDLAPQGGERRDQTTQLVYLRWLIRIFGISMIGMAASVFACIVLVWQLYQDRDFNLYLECVNFAATGVTVPVCKPYEHIIDSKTNAYRRWSQRLKDKPTEQQQRESKKDEPK